MIHPRRKPRPIPGHVARAVECALGRICAGEDWRHVVADYGPFERGRGPDLAPLAALVTLRDRVGSFLWVIEQAMPAVKLTATWRHLRRALKRAGGRRRK